MPDTTVTPEDGGWRWRVTCAERGYLGDVLFCRRWCKLAWLFGLGWEAKSEQPWADITLTSKAARQRTPMGKTRQPSAWRKPQRENSRGTGTSETFAVHFIVVRNERGEIVHEEPLVRSES